MRRGRLRLIRRAVSRGWVPGGRGEEEEVGNRGYMAERGGRDLGARDPLAGTRGLCGLRYWPSTSGLGLIRWPVMHDRRNAAGRAADRTPAARCLVRPARKNL